MSDQKIVDSKVKCRKCKGTSLKLIEVWSGHDIVWDQEMGKFDLEDGSLEPGNPKHVEAKCDCGHHWKIRGANQIHDIILTH